MNAFKTAGETAKITIFKDARWGQVRTAGNAANPQFCLTDICRALELSNITEVKKRLKVDGLSSTEVIDSLGRVQQVTFINEQNLYRLIMRSDKPQAEMFQDWVFEEVLPSIRRTGSYQVAVEPVEMSGRLTKVVRKEGEPYVSPMNLRLNLLPLSHEVNGQQPILYEDGWWYNYAEAVRRLGGTNTDASKRKKKYPQHFKVIYGKTFCTAEYLMLLADYMHYRQLELKFEEQSIVKGGK